MLSKAPSSMRKVQAESCTGRPAALPSRLPLHAALRPAGVLSRPAIRTGDACRLAATSRSGGGAGVLDSPVTAAPQPGEKTSTNKKRPPIYKVLLHNDPYNRRAYVVGVLTKVVKTLGIDEAIDVMQTAHISGVALVTACAQDEAETYVEDLRLNGLQVSMEPGC